jgi:hypothetical protein
MAETVILLAQLNGDWTLSFCAPSRTPETRPPQPYWAIRKASDPRAGAQFRRAHMVREYITFIVAKDGPVSPEAQAAIDGLPAKCVSDAPSPPRRRERPSVHRDCRRCGSVFVMSYNGGRVFCSGSCKDAYHGEKRTARKAARRAAHASTAATVTEQPPAAISERSPRIPPMAPAAERPLTREQELAEQMKRDRIELMAAKGRQDLPERISAQKKHHGRWAST